MEIPKPSEADVEYFRSIVPEDVAVTVKPMFGNVAAFVNDNMFMGLFGPGIGLRLPDAARDKLLAIDGAAPFGPPDRPMKQYATMPMSWRDEPALTAQWVERSLTHVGAMPPKRRAPKKGKARKPRS